MTTQCEVRYYTREGMHDQAAKRCDCEAEKLLQAGPHLSLPDGMLETFLACKFHARHMTSRARHGLTCDAVEVA